MCGGMIEMNWKFWKRKKETDRTIIRVVTRDKDIYVEAQTNAKALKLYDRLRSE